MSKIRTLPLHTINKIAAGEVIERPMYVVKELVENAIDANADSIMISLYNSGLDTIVVADNGEGMEKEDILQCYKRHTTSKIDSDEDLFHIQTLGFRGEALASIAAISNLTIKSRQKEALAGTEITIEGGVFKKTKPIGMQIGTVVKVDKLFSTVPARKKFLKSSTTELRYIMRKVTEFMIAYPHIRFTLIHNGKILLTSTKLQSSLQRVELFFGESIAKNFVEINYAESYLSLSGFISKPQFSLPSHSKQHIFVNKRSIQNNLISSAVKSAYGTLLEPVMHPVFIFFLTIPYELVDVNVHPRKEEILFHSEDMLREFILKAVTQTLSKNNLTFFDKRWKDNKGDSAETVMLREGGTHSYAAQILKDAMNIDDTIVSSDIMQVHRTYLVMQTKTGLLLVDQHAAHERILYEKLLSIFKSKKKIPTKYYLSKKIKISISHTEILLIEEYKELLSSLGFELYQKDNELLVAAVPELFKDRDIEIFINEIIDDLQSDNSIKDVDMQTERMISYLACRSAVMAGDKLSEEQCKQIIEDLKKTENQYTCPHGRPTQYEIPFAQLHKEFKRI